MVIKRSSKKSKSRAAEFLQKPRRRFDARDFIAMHAGENSHAAVIAAAARTDEKKLLQRVVVETYGPRPKRRLQPRSLGAMQLAQRVAKILSACTDFGRM